MIIECRYLTKTYKTGDIQSTAVDNVSLIVEKGDFIVVLGHSGSGKTTLLSLIGGLTKPENGKVFINGTENWSQSDKALSTVRNGTIGFIFQFASLIPTLTAMENILLPLSFGGPNMNSEEKALDLLDQVGLKDKADAFPGQLSGGQQRRIAIARAFINQPDIILADEPTGDLDEETEKEILGLFRKYNEQRTTFIVVTHNSELAATQTNARIMTMRNGILKEENIQ